MGNKQKINLSFFFLILALLTSSPLWAAPEAEESAAKWLAPYMSDLNKTELNSVRKTIKKVDEKPPVVRNKIVKAARLLLSADNADAVILAHIMDELQNIPSDKIEAVVNATLKCFGSDMDIIDRLAIVNILKNTPSDQLEGTVNTALKCFGSDMEAHVRISILKEINEIRPADRDDVTKKALLLFKNHQGKLDRGLWVLAKIPAPEREEVLRLASTFFRDNLNLMNKVSIIATITAIPAPQRARAVENVQRRLEAAQQNGELTESNRLEYIRRFLHEETPQQRDVPRQAGAFQVHNVAKAAGTTRREDGREEGVTIKRTRALIKEKMAGQTVVSRQRIEAFIESYIDHNKRLSTFTKEQRNALSHALINAIKWDDLTLVYSFMTKLHKKQLNAWAAGFIEDSLTAYDGNNSLSCVAGINERIFLALRELHLAEFADIFGASNLNQERSDFLARLTLDPKRAEFIAKILVRNGYKVGETTAEEAGKILNRYVQENLPFLDRSEKEAYLAQDNNQMVINEFIIEPLVEDLKKAQESQVLPFVAKVRGDSPLTSGARAASRSRSSSLVHLGTASEDLSTTRHLRAKQDAAYEASLHADQEKARRRQEAAATNQAGPDETSRPLHPEELRKARLKALEKKNPKAKKDSDSEE